jgi:hypothetical protein
MMMIVSANRYRTHSSPDSSVKNSACLVVVALMLWGSGFSCFICCANALAAVFCASHKAISKQLASNGPAASQESCSELSCCDKPQGNQTDEAFSKPSAVKPCCLQNIQAVPVTLPQRVDDRAVAAIIIQQPIAFELNLQRPPLTFHAPVSNRGSTYLLCCALLI